jgi:hypothetical protein
VAIAGAMVVSIIPSSGLLIAITGLVASGFGCISIKRRQAGSIRGFSFQQGSLGSRPVYLDPMITFCFESAIFGLFPNCAIGNHMSV